jgi:hypothetical protein
MENSRFLEASIRGIAATGKHYLCFSALFSVGRDLADGLFAGLRPDAPGT